MGSNPNLIPTPIVDKNGVASTRLKKQDTHKSSSALDWLNPVAAIRTGSERRKIAAAVQELLFREDWRDPVQQRGENLSQAFRKSSDGTFLKNALVAAELVTRKGQSTESFRRSRSELTRLLSLHGDHGIDVTDSINAIAAHREWLEEQDDPYAFDTFISTLSMVTSRYFPDNTQEDGSVRNIEAHCQAYAHYREESKYGYSVDRAAMRAVDAHPDDVERVLAFMDVRGSDAFSEEAFAEYKRIQPAVADGWL